MNFSCFAWRYFWSSAARLVSHDKFFISLCNASFAPQFFSSLYYCHDDHAHSNTPVYHTAPVEFELFWGIFAVVKFRPRWLDWRVLHWCVRAYRVRCLGFFRSWGFWTITIVCLTESKIMQWCYFGEWVSLLHQESTLTFNLRNVLNHSLASIKKRT